MNPRILKKLSQRAAKVLEQLGEVKGLEMVVVGKDCLEEIERTVKVDRKHHLRWKHLPNTRGNFIQKRGTVGYGAMSGGYELEWWDQCAYSMLRDFLYFELCSDFLCNDEEPSERIKHLKNPSCVFRHAKNILKSKHQN